MSDDFNLDKALRIFYPGKQIFKRYVLVRQLGHGEMGVVWLADDKQLGQQVVLKFLSEVAVSDVSTLNNEIQKVYQLAHPNIARTYDFLNEGKMVAVSTEYIDGSSLTQLLLEQSQRAFCCDDIKPWVEQICRTMSYAHNKVRMVHRGLRPSNILLTGNGEIKITDFGVSLIVSDFTKLSSVGYSSCLNLQYMSPRQLKGENATQSDDVYSLGVVIYELLTGKPPFYSGNIPLKIQKNIPPTMMGRRRELGVLGLDTIPEAWEVTVSACLSKSAADRPQNIIDISKSLQIFNGLSSYNDPERLLGVMKTGVDDQSIKKKTFSKVWFGLLVLFFGFVVWFLADAEPDRLSYLDSMEIVNLSLNVWNDVEDFLSVSDLDRVILENQALPELQALGYAYRAILNMNLGRDFEDDLAQARDICLMITKGGVDAEYSSTVNEVNGISCYVHSDYDQAIDYFSKALDTSSLTDDHRASLLRLRALSYFSNEQNQLEKALADIDEALRLNLSTDEHIYYMYMLKGWIYSDVGESAKCIDSYTRCLSLNVSPDQKAESYFWRANMYYAEGRFVEAKADLEAGLQLDHLSDDKRSLLGDRLGVLK